MVTSSWLEAMWAFLAINSMGLPVPVAIVLSVIVCTVLGMVIERVAYKPLRHASKLAVLITAIGASYFLQNVALLLLVPIPNPSRLWLEMRLSSWQKVCQLQL